jgi:hypothetical protein
VLDFALDGEIDPEALVMPNADGYEQEIITYDRQNRFNAAIHAAAVSLVPEVSDTPTRRQLARVAELLAPQGRYRRRSAVSLPSRARRWESLYELALDVLNGFGLHYEPGKYAAPGFVLNTWRVWEDLMTVGVRIGMGSTMTVAQRPFVLGYHYDTDKRPVRVTPDVAVLQHDLPPIALIDAKYKGRFEEPEHRITESDLYEGLAFARATECGLVILVYPATMQTENREVGSSGLFSRIVIGPTTILGVEVQALGISQIGGLRRFARNLAASVSWFL